MTRREAFSPGEGPMLGAVAAPAEERLQGWWAQSPAEEPLVTSSLCSLRQVF